MGLQLLMTVDRASIVLAIAGTILLLGAALSLRRLQQL